MHTSKSDESLNTVQNLAGLETQIVKYEADIRKHISIEHQLQLFADDLKRNIVLLEKEKAERDDTNLNLIEELKRDKSTLREFIKMKDKTIVDLQNKISEFTEKNEENSQAMQHQKQKYELQIKDLKQKISVSSTQFLEPSLKMQLNHNVKTPLGQLSTTVTTGSQKNFTPQRKDFQE